MADRVVHLFIYFIWRNIYIETEKDHERDFQLINTAVVIKFTIYRNVTRYEKLFELSVTEVSIDILIDGREDLQVEFLCF